MESLIEKVENLKREPIAEVISQRMKEFEDYGIEKEDKVFSELCFCLLTANFQAEKCIQIQRDMGRGFEILPQEELAKKLKDVGHRFWPQRAERIVKARDCKTELCSLVFPKEGREPLLCKKSGKEMREWLVKNVKGLGMKESSHFLRNVGYKDVAIIDFHIVDLLVDEGMIERPKTITSRKYLEIEKILEGLGKKVELNLAELDLYLWYLETGKVLK
jgi:N-glycosylase/DNA lyase